MHRTVLAALALAACTAPVEESGRPNPLDQPPPPPVSTTVPDDTDPILPTLELPEFTLVINEVMAKNDSTWWSADGSTPDWVEIANVGDEAVDLTYVALEDGNGNRWDGAGRLEAGERLFLTSDDLGFALSDAADTLTLYGVTEVIDEVSWEGLQRDVAIARLPDLTGELERTAWPTPDAPNGAEPSPSLDAANEFVFVADRVHRIDFTLDAANYDKINSTAENWGRAGLVFDGIELPEIGLRLKGSASFDLMNQKPAFKVDLNKVVPGTRFKTLKGFNLHNGNVLDPTRARDHISYSFARAGEIMAPRVGWAEVYVNGNYYGIYMIIEQHDDVMMEHFFPGTGETGVMLEPNSPRGGGGFGWGDFGSGSPVSDWDYEEGPIPADNDVMAALATTSSLVKGPATDANVEALWDVVDQHNLVTYMAWEAIISHTDGYKAPNNWRVFIHPDDKKVHLVPAGAEWTWDNNSDALSWGGDLADWCLDNGNCRRLYGERLLEMVLLVEDIGLQDEFARVSEMLAPIIAIDPRSPHSQTTVDNARDDTYGNIESFPLDARGEICADMPNLAGCSP